MAVINMSKNQKINMTKDGGRAYSTNKGHKPARQQSAGGIF